MKTSLNCRVEAADEDVVVTLDGTNCMVRYVKADTGLNLYHVRGDERAPIHHIHFLSRARQLANAKAKELGWMRDDAPLPLPAKAAILNLCPCALCRRGRARFSSGSPWQP